MLNPVSLWFVHDSSATICPQVLAALSKRFLMLAGGYFALISM